MADFLKVEEVLANLDLRKDMLACEFGSGAGIFTISLAKKLSQGRVYALDIQEEKLSALKGRSAKEKITNVYTILCDLEAPQGSTLQDNYLDIVLIPNVLFQAENKNAIMTEARRILKSGGQLLVIDWLKPSPFGPKESLASPDTVKKMATELSLFLKKEFAAGDYHYGLLFTK